MKTGLHLYLLYLFLTSLQDQSKVDKANLRFTECETTFGMDLYTHCSHSTGSHVEVIVFWFRFVDLAMETRRANQVREYLDFFNKYLLFQSEIA